MLKVHRYDITECFSASSVYTMPELEGLISGYIASQNLMNEHNQAFVDVDELLRSTIAWEQQGHKTEDIKYIRRDKLTQRIMYKFQTWHKISIKGGESIARYVVFCSNSARIDHEQGGRNQANLDCGQSPS